MIKYLLGILFTISLIGCTSTKYVEVPVDRVKTEYKDRVSIDTVMSRDSIYIFQKQDTVFYTKYKYLYKTKELRDTISKQDTVTVVNTVEVLKETNKLYNWQKLLMVLGGGAIAFSLFKGYKLIKSWI